MAYDVGVRSYLQGQGVQNSDIGYDPNSGNVTVRGQNFIKPSANLAGTTYDSQQNLDNAYGNYKKSLPVIQSNETPTSTGATSPAGSLGATMGKFMGQLGISQNDVNAQQNKQAQPTYTNPYAQTIKDIIQHLSDKSAAMQQPVDIYSTPEYAAAKAQQDKSAQQSMRQSQESMGQTGFGRSTNLGEAVNRQQNDANNYLQTQLVPQIQNAIQSRDQQSYQNLLSQYNAIYQLANEADTQHQQDITNANADRTFNYNAGQDTINNNRNAALDTYNQGQDTIKNNQSDRTYNLDYQKQMADLTGYISDGKGGFVPTTAQQKQDLTDAWTETTNMGSVTPALSKLTGIPVGTPTQTAKNQAQQIAVSNRNATNSENSTKNTNSNANINQLMDVWKATGVAPAGLESLGVKQGMKYVGDGVPKAVTVDSKTSTDNASLIQQDLKDASSLDEANKLIEANKDQLTDADYKALKKAAIDQF